MNPAAAFRFSVFLTDSPVGGIESPLQGLGTLAKTTSAVAAARFAEVSGIDAGIEVETYQEGGRNTNPLRFSRWGRFSNLVFRRGVTADSSLWDWYMQVQFLPVVPPRKNGFVLLQAGTAATALPGIGGQPVAAWFFSNGLPEKLTGPGLNAARNEIAIETLEIAHEGLLRLGQAMIPGLTAFVQQLES